MVEIAVGESAWSPTTSTHPEDLRRWKSAEDDSRREVVVVEINRSRGGRDASNRCAGQVLRAGEGASRAARASISSWSGPSGSSDLRAVIARRLPGLAPLMKNVMIAVNEEYADDDGTNLCPVRELR